MRGLLALVAQSDCIGNGRSVFVEAAQAHFRARRAALLLFSELPPSSVTEKMQDNPVSRYLFNHHAPVHEAQILTPEEWTQWCPWSDHGHVLAAPLVQNGALVGLLALTREQNAPAFDAADVRDATALCLHLCGKIAQNAPPPRPDAAPAAQLTPRETQITALVARGLTNAQIGSEMCLSPETIKAALKTIFRKTGVMRRAQLAAHRA